MHYSKATKKKGRKTEKQKEEVFKFGKPIEEPIKIMEVKDTENKIPPIEVQKKKEPKEPKKPKEPKPSKSNKKPKQSKTKTDEKKPEDDEAPFVVELIKRDGEPDVKTEEKPKQQQPEEVPPPESQAPSEPPKLVLTEKDFENVDIEALQQQLVQVFTKNSFCLIFTQNVLSN